MGFAESLSLSTKNLQGSVNKVIIERATELFNSVVSKTPVAAMGEPTRGQLINNWFAGQGVGNYNRSSTGVFDTSGASSYGQIRALVSSGEFIGKDGEVSLTNSTSYGYRAEYHGWNFAAKEDRWTGTKPYAMVRNSMVLIASKYK